MTSQPAHRSRREEAAVLTRERLRSASREHSRSSPGGAISVGAWRRRRRGMTSSPMVRAPDPPSRRHCSRWESPLPSPRTWPRAGPTVPSARSSRPGRRSASWARTNFLVWLIRTSGAADLGPSAAHLCTGAARRAAARPIPASAVDGERGTSGPAWRPAGQGAGQSPISASGQRDDKALEASAGNDAAVAAYRLSVQAGNPLSERRLAQMFGRTSRRWARARIADARQASPLPDSPSTPVTAYP